ncbi:MAG: hypothetical protein EOM67_10710 [Spirochaetia bacterium]|nr:hypothetical protein [Spirochaetia bacterium]
MKQKQKICWVIILTLVSLLMYISCEVDNEGNQSNKITIQPYDRVVLSDFTSFVVDEGVRDEMTLFLGVADEEDKAELVGSIFQSFAYAFDGMDLEGAEPYENRSLDALLHLQFQDEGLRYVVDDTDSEDEEDEVVISDIYVDNLEVLLEGGLSSLTKLLYSLQSIGEGIFPYELGANAHFGISARMETKADAWMLELLADDELDIDDDATASEDQGLEGFLSLFGEFTIEVEAEESDVPKFLSPRDEVAPDFTATISGKGNLSLGLNYMIQYYDDEFHFHRIPGIVEVIIPEFKDVDVNDFQEALEAYWDAVGEDDIDGAYVALKALLWGASSSKEISLKMYLGDATPTVPISVFSGKAAMDFFIDVIGMALGMLGA